MNTLIVLMMIKKPVDNLKRENFFNKLKNKSPDEEEIQRTKEFFKLLIIKMEKNYLNST